MTPKSALQIIATASIKKSILYTVGAFVICIGLAQVDAINITSKDASEPFTPEIFLNTPSNGSYVINVVPPNALGISYNELQTLDLKNAITLTINNKNAAKIIVLDVQGNSETELYGNIDVTGTEKSDLRIISIKGINVEKLIISGTSFVELRTEDINNQISGTIKIQGEGITCSSDLSLKSAGVIFDGKVTMQSGTLYLEQDGTCLITRNSFIETKDGAFSSTCKGGFTNNGNIDIAGLIYIESPSALNQKLWETVSWTPAMENQIPAECKYGGLKIDSWHCVPWDDISGRKYEQPLARTGQIKASHIYLNMTNGGFSNLDGAHLIGSGANTMNSTIVTTGDIINRHKRFFTQDGFLKEGFDFTPSLMQFQSDMILFSSSMRIVNDASTISVDGNSNMYAGSDIIEQGISGSYLYFPTFKYHGRPKGGFMPVSEWKRKYGPLPGKGNYRLNYEYETVRRCRQEEKCDWEYDAQYERQVGVSGVRKYVCKPYEVCGDEQEIAYPYINELSGAGRRDVSKALTSKLVVGGNSYKTAGGDIRESGSVNIINKNSYLRAGRKYFLESHKVQGQAPIQQSLLPNNVGNAIANTLAESNAVALQSTTLEGKGVNYQGGTHIAGGTIDAKADEGIDINAGKMLGASAKLHATQNDIDIHGTLDSYIVTQDSSRKHSELTQGITGQYSAIGAYDGNVEIIADNGNVNMAATLLASKDDITVSGTLINAAAQQMVVDNFLSTTKRDLISKTKTEEHWSTSAMLPSIIAAEGQITFNALEKVNIDASTLAGKEGVNVNAPTLEMEGQGVEKYYTKDVEQTSLTMPGLGGSVLDMTHGKKPSDALIDNIPFLAAIDRAADTDSATDLAPGMQLGVEIYGMLDTLAGNYETTNNGLVALAAQTGMAELGVTTEGPLPVSPTGIGIKHKKEHHESSTVDYYASLITGDVVNINTETTKIDGSDISATTKLHLVATETLDIKAQGRASHDASSHNIKTLGVSGNSNTLKLSGSQDKRSSNYDEVSYYSPTLSAGEEIFVSVGKNAHVEGTFKGPKGEMFVKGKLNFKSVQDTANGNKKHDRIGVDLTVTPEGYFPGGGFSRGRGTSKNRWANDIAGIQIDDVYIETPHLCLDGAAILGSKGTVNATLIEYNNILNEYRSEYNEFGFDVDPANLLPGIDHNGRWLNPTGSGIHGMALFDHEDTRKEEKVYATISNGINLVTNSQNIKINRDPSKIRELTLSSDKHISLAMPVVNVQEASARMKRIGNTVKDIGNDIHNYFKESLQTSTDTPNLELEKITKAYDDFEQAVKDSSISEEEKQSILARTSILMQNGFEGTVYVQVQQNVATENTPTDITNEKHTNGVTLDPSLFANTNNNDPRIKSNIERNKNFAEVNLETFMRSMERELEENPSEEVFTYFEILCNTGKEILAQGWKSQKEIAIKIVSSPQFQGFLEYAGGAGEAAIGIAFALATCESVVGGCAGMAIAAHGLDTALAGANKMLTSNDQQTLASQTIEAAGFSKKVADNLDSYLGVVGGFYAGAKTLVKGLSEFSSKGALKEGSESVVTVAKTESKHAGQIDGLINDFNKIETGFASNKNLLYHNKYKIEGLDFAEDYNNWLKTVDPSKIQKHHVLSNKGRIDSPNAIKNHDIFKERILDVKILDSNRNIMPLPKEPGLHPTMNVHPGGAHTNAYKLDMNRELEKIRMAVRNKIITKDEAASKFWELVDEEKTNLYKGESNIYHKKGK